jgi:two-component system, NtrC family, nitrogen regulation sensor histidine kinase GlnL
MLTAAFSGLEHLSTACFALTGHGRFVYANAAGESLLQRSAKQLIGLRPEDVFVNAQRLLIAMDKAMAAHGSFAEQELELAVVHNGSPIPIVVNATVNVLTVEHASVLIEMKQVDAQLKIAREERQREQAQANRELIRTLAHEIKNPLGGIRGAAQLLADELINPEHNEFTDVIISEADRLQSLVDRLLTPHQRPKNALLNIHDVLNRAMILIRSEFSGEVALKPDFDISIPEFVGDAEQLMQAVLNITRNAAQVMQGQANAQIQLQTRVTRGVTLLRKRYRLALQLTITDNGPGIAPELLDKIFFPLVSAREGGTGLGLTIAQTFIAQHEGTVDVDSKPGQTSFRIQIPLTAAINTTEQRTT